MVEWQSNIGNVGWIKHPSTKKLAIILGHEGFRFVGGAVRDALFGIDREDTDVDIATLFTPEKVTSLMEHNGVKVIPTGLKFGTVTAVIDKKSFEITTLRHDVKTDGRHAEVAFHDSWEEDAKRRDFTLNALYANSKGDVFDYLDGFKDLKDGRIKFIGDAKTRIEEDALRILRYFRFYAHFGIMGLDQSDLEACINAKKSLNNLSVERILMELLKLLEAPNPIPSLLIMEENGFLGEILPEAQNVSLIKNLVEVERIIVDPGPLRRLSLLMPKRNKVLNEVAKRLKFSNVMTGEMKALLYPDATIKSDMSDLAIKHALYHHQYSTFRDHLIINSAPDEAGGLHAVLERAKDCEIPKFPVKGRDLIEKGFEQGQAMGNQLDRLEKIWLNSDFVFSKEDLLREVD